MRQVLARPLRSPVWRAGPQYNVCTQGASLGRKCFLCLNLQLPPRSPYPLILYKLNGVWVRFAHRVPRLPCNSTFGLFRTSPIRATHCKSFIQALLQILCVSWGSVHMTLHRTSPILGSDCFGLGPIRSPNATPAMQFYIGTVSDQSDSCHTLQKLYSSIAANPMRFVGLGAHDPASDQSDSRIGLLRTGSDSLTSRAHYFQG